ncbi:Charged Multivesicular Body Protein 1B [Manis pentadactyla]|nr:Charged Multivesicular Body Protein 1B [Manis pentadactyla]
MIRRVRSTTKELGEQLFNLEFAPQELNRNAKKCNKEEKAETIKTKKVTKSMAGVIKSMDATLRNSALVDKFETLYVQIQQMEDTMSTTTTLTPSQIQVDMLLQEMADKQGSSRRTLLSSGH